MREKLNVQVDVRILFLWTPSLALPIISTRMCSAVEREPPSVAWTEVTCNFTEEKYIAGTFPTIR
jgi:hypothetical protein